MQIIKPLRIGCMTKPIAGSPRSSLSVTGMVGFDLLDPAILQTEQDMWNSVKQQIGESGVIDYWMPKQTGEVLIWGKAIAPENVPIKTMEVKLDFGEIRKTLAVHGRRYWVPNLLGGSLSDTEPFVEMPLTYERAFGGAGFGHCPVGKGYNANRRIDAGETVELPNVEFANKQILHPGDTPLPACFMPADLTWPGRLPQGTFDRNWFKHRFPAMPEDYDWSAYNLAPPDQRIAGYFHGNEAFSLSGFHADHPLIASRLPGLRMRGFFRSKDTIALQEIPMVLDTVCLFPSGLFGVLLFRGGCETMTYDGRDISELMVACEHIGHPRPFEHYEEVFALRTGEDAALHVLSDFQLMPPFSDEVKRRLDASQDEALQAREAKRKKLDEWLPLYASAVAGVAVPASFFSRVSEAAAPPPVPIITKEDIAQGNVDLVAVKNAITGVADHLRAEADSLRSQAEEIQAQTSRLHAAATANRGGRMDSETRAMLPSAVRDKLDAVGHSMRAVADRLESDPKWPMAAAFATLAAPSQAATVSAIDQLLGSEDESIVAQRDKLRQLKEAMQASSNNDPEDIPSEGRENQIAMLRQTAAALLGESVPVTAASGNKPEVSSADDFLTSMGLGQYAVDSTVKSETGLAESVSRARRLLETPPDQLGQQIVAALPSMVAMQSGAASIDLAPVTEQASKLASSFGQPLPTASELASRLTFDNPPDIDQETAKAIADNKRSAAVQVAQHLPAAVKNGEIDWEEFLGQMGIGQGVPAAGSITNALASLRVDESVNDRALRQARALALGEPWANRFGFDIPDEHPDEAAAMEISERFLHDPDLQSFQKAVVPEILRAQGEVIGASGMDFDKISAAIGAVAMRHSLTMPPAVAAASRASSKAMAALQPGAMSAAMLRDKVPEANLRHRKARQESPRSLIDAKDLSDEIGRCVGDIVCNAVSRGESLAGRDLAGANLRGANLAGVDLTGAFLEHADLSGANLDGARCEGAVFSGARLVNATLRGTFLARANFSGAVASDADFTAADLSDAMLVEGDFRQANLRQVSFGKCNAMKTDFSGARLDESRCEGGQFIESNLLQASLTGALWQKAILINATMEGCTGHGVSLRECALVKIKGAGCDFTNGSFESAIVTKSAFPGLQADNMAASGSCWQDCDLTGARLVRARLQRANFVRAILDDADLTAADLRSALLTEASLREATLEGAQLFESMLRGADFKGAQLRHSNLHWADLEDARFDDADLTGARRLLTILEKPSARAE